jgi:hypothetical protein
MNQIKEKENICDKLEAEIVSLRKDLEKSKTQMKFIKGYETLDNILSNQRSPDDKTGLGYKESLKIVKGESSTNMSTSEKPTSYANLSRETTVSLTNQKMIRRSSQNWINPTMQTNMKQGSNMCLNLIKLDRQRTIPTSKFFIPRHPNFFYGYCFSCGNFGHKVVSCRTFRHNKM